MKHRSPAHRRAGILGAGIWLSLAGSAAAEATDDGYWHLGVYGGKAAEERLLDILTRFNTGFRDAWLVAFAPAYVYRRTERWRFEVEGQAVKHFGDQDHWEFNAAWLARWMQFPWDAYVETRAALGLGVSYATEIPVIEPRAKLEEGESRKFSWLRGRGDRAGASGGQRLVGVCSPAPSLRRLRPVPRPAWWVELHFAGPAPPALRWPAARDRACAA